MSKSNTVLKGSGFIGLIRKNMKDKDGKQVAQYFATVAIPKGEGDSKKYQYISCYVSKSLVPQFESAMKDQVVDAEGKSTHAMSGKIAKVEIGSPFFEINDGFLNGSGILMSVTLS